MAASGSTGKGGSGKSRLQSVSAAEFPVVPSPGFVIKVLRTNGEKIFVNLCEAAEVPMMNVSIGFNKWPFMIMTPVRTIQEEKEGSGGSAEISVYDAIVNPAVLVTCGKNPEAKDATCARVLRLLKKQYGEDLQEEYKLPKIAKRYKGEIQTVLIPVDVQQLSKTRSSISVRIYRNASVDSAIHEPFQTRFSFDIFFSDNAMIRISRTLAEFLTMRQQLMSFPDKMIQDRAFKAGEIYVLTDGDENLVLDVHFLLETVEGVESWLCKLLSTLHVEKCKCRALVDFLTPKESDMDIMESMLSCKGGLNGAWPEVEAELADTENSISE
eukprot:gene9641-6897_t